LGRLFSFLPVLFFGGKEKYQLGVGREGAVIRFLPREGWSNLYVLSFLQTFACPFVIVPE